MTQAINQEASQFRKKLPVASDGRLAMPAAIKAGQSGLDDSKNEMGVATRNAKHKKTLRPNRCKGMPNPGRLLALHALRRPEECIENVFERIAAYLVLNACRQS